MGYSLENWLGDVFFQLIRVLMRHLFFGGKPCIFKAWTWIWLSEVNRPALPKERCIKVIKLLLKQNGSEKKKSHNRGPPPPLTGYSICCFLTDLIIKVHDTNRYTVYYINHILGYHLISAFWDVQELFLRSKDLWISNMIIQMFPNIQD
jgi:hypothetical protein